MLDTLAQWVKNTPAIQETQETRVWSLCQEDSLGGGNGNPLQYSCLENSMDRGALGDRVHGVTNSQTQLSMCPHTHMHTQLSSPPFYRSANKQRHRELTWLAQCLMVNGRSKSNTTNLIPDPSLNYHVLEAFLFFSIQLMLIRPRGEIPWWASG